MVNRKLVLIQLNSLINDSLLQLGNSVIDEKFDQLEPIINSTLKNLDKIENTLSKLLKFNTISPIETEEEYLLIDAISLNCYLAMNTLESLHPDVEYAQIENKQICLLGFDDIADMLASIVDITKRISKQYKESNSKGILGYIKRLFTM